MLQLFPSNKTENLAVVIAEVMKSKPLSGSFDKEIILTQSHGMGTWLQQEISAQLGVAAMIDCVLPASFIWQLMQTLRPDQSHVPIFEKQYLRWELFKRLPYKLEDIRYKQLADYVCSLSTRSQSSASEAPSEHIIFELSEALADMFDAYQNYRPDWISNWENKAFNFDSCSTETSRELAGLEAWQFDLWLELYPEVLLDERRHRTVLLNSLLESLQQPSEKTKSLLPERIFVFGLSSLPPQWLPIMSALGECCDIHFLVQNPCQYYWGDVVTESQQLKLEQSLVASGVSVETAADTFLESNPLLASWGKLGRDYISLLLQNESMKEIPVSLYEDYGDHEDKEMPSALSCLQTDILKLQAKQYTVDRNDNSIRYACNYSHLREVEALQDYLFNLLNESPDIAPRDVIVMMPDVQDFASLIDAVFSRPAYDQHGQAQYLSYGISDQLIALDQPMIDVLSGVLQLSKNRISATEVLDWLDIEAIRERFSIEEHELPQIHEWVEGLSIRWGLSETHRGQHLGIKGSGEGNTWSSGFRRLLAGYVYGVSDVVDSPGGGTFAQTQFGQDSQELAGKLMRFLDVIDQTVTHQNGRHSVQKWLKVVTSIWQSWFDSDFLSDEIIRLMDEAIEGVLEQVSATAFDDEIGFGVIGTVLSASFEKVRVSQRFLAGRINFCTLMPMRSIPFKVVCMLGMNEGQYPRPEQKHSFDLLNISEARVGDRNRREDDRYLFLEAICSARQCLYLSYCGNNISDNSERFPSLLVSELRDYCSKFFQLDDSTQDVLEFWTHKHRLQPFHLSYFDESDSNAIQGKPQTFRSEWANLVIPSEGIPIDDIDINRDSKQSSPENELPQFDLFDEPCQPVKKIDLASVSKMAEHPLRFYYQQHMGLRATGIDAPIQNSEPFSLSHLDVHKMKVDLVGAWCQPELESASVASCWALSDRLPRAPIDKIYIEDTETSLMALKDKMSVLFDGECSLEAKAISLGIGNNVLVGEFLVSNMGCIELSVSANIAGRFFGIWAKHVFWNLHCARNSSSGGSVGFGETIILSPDKMTVLPILETETVEQYAKEILDAYLNLNQKPFAFLPRSTYAMLFESESKIKSAFKGIRLDRGEISGEKDDPYWYRFCSLSDVAEDGSAPLEFDRLPELSDSIFYRQVSENLDRVRIETLEGSTH